MSSNHLIVGLGGTGGKIIRAFAKTLFQEFRRDTPPNVKIGYLYIDSSDEMMSLDDPSWKILGSSVQLDKKSQLLIREANLVAQLENINNFPGIKNWIGDRGIWRTILSGMDVTKAAGGQKRRLGRFLFACRIKEFKELLRSRVSDLQATGSVAVTFHICCGLAGGTGSGSIIDVISQIRESYEDRGNYRILVYALLPETHPNANWDTGNYHANGYAALSELNALSIGRYKPHDLSGIKDRLDIPDPFNGCYVFTNANENGLAVDVDKEVPSIVADFLYQKIVGVTHLSWPSLGRIENAENGDSSPETDALKKNKERSKRFLTFGIKRLAIPEDEIREYLAYSFARQAALQLAFNNWSESLGYVDEPRNLDFGEYVRQKEVLQAWRLTDEHITLSIGILSDEISNPKWKQISIDWQEVIPNFKSVARGLEKKVWLDELQKMCEQRYNHNWRGVGVRKFYENKIAARKEHAKEIRRLIETELFGEWKNGVKSMHDLNRELSVLLQALEERTKDADDKITKWRDAEANAAELVAANSREWAKIGLAGNLLGKHSKVLDAQAQNLQDQLIYRTRTDAWMFAKALLQDLSTEINSLKSDIQNSAGTIAGAVKHFNDGLAERCADEQRDLRMQLVRYYNPDLVKDYSRVLTRDRTEQIRQASEVRQDVIEQLGEYPNFTAFNSRLPGRRFVEILEKCCVRSAVSAHDNLVSADKNRQPLLKVNIVNKLARDYGGRPDELKKYVTELVTRAGNYMSFEPLEINKAAPGISSRVPTCLTQFTVILPKTPDNPEFMATLQNVFRGARAGDVEIIESDVMPNEITIISITNLFPLRFLKPAAFLRQKYEQRANGENGARVRLEVHTEGDGTQFPKLFVPSMEDLRTAGLPYVLLGKCLNIIQQRKSPTTGASRLYLLTKDIDGFDCPPVELGATLIECEDKIDPDNFEIIRGAVKEGLLHNYAHVDKKSELRSLLLAEVEHFKTSVDGDINDPTYLRILQAGRTASTLISQET